MSQAATPPEGEVRVVLDAKLRKPSEETKQKSLIASCRSVRSSLVQEPPGEQTMSKLETLHKNLLAEWAKESSRNLKTVGELIGQVKHCLSDFDLLSKVDPSALVVIHRDVFEIDALYAVVRSDLVAFKDAISVVHSFYESQKDDSVNKYLMIGLDLMYLLASNRLSDFHMLLEQIDQSLQQTNPFIQTPVKLEQSLMEGAYNKVVLTEKTIPSPYYAVFIRIMMDTVRGEIAVCMEKSFKRLSAKDAAQLLLFSSPQDIVPFAEKRSWKLQGDVYNFEGTKSVEEAKQKTHLDTTRIAQQTIYYAKQLEMIV
ncbi:hypothetical protein QR680_012939 [Steinernema hermaphroditum]|uniref:26S proteasome non-ATPase regulatory subunit 8 n=1 Tax=Steinernema hermaphroditum TaxID=289476 RepID=A0AA39I5F6_9BILA|nr:hypothetical protein QR680_012939 [Steinernema hermaphroditum]